MQHWTILALASFALPIALVACSGSDSGSGVGPGSLSNSGAGGAVAPGAGGAAAAAPGAGGAVPGAGGTVGGVGGSVVPGAGGVILPGAGGAAPGAGGFVSPGAGGAAAGAGGTSGAGGVAPATGGTAGAGGGSVGGLDPVIPAISGDCPMFKAGTSTATVLGEPATIIAGAQKQGTGSLLFYWYGTAKLGDVSFLPQAIKDDIAAQGGIVFAPSAAKNTGGDCSGTGTWGLDDFKVSDQVVACAVKNYGINPKRIYATGCSAGGLQTGCMAIARSSYIAAVAPNSGGITIGYPKLQDPMRVPNVITMNGGAGDNVIVNFGNTSEGFDNYILKYGGFAVNCIHSSGHCGAPADVYASAWQFMKDHPFGTKPSPYASGLPMGFSPVCKIFTMTSMGPIGGY